MQPISKHSYVALSGATLARLFVILLIVTGCFGAWVVWQPATPPSPASHAAVTAPVTGQISPQTAAATLAPGKGSSSNTLADLLAQEVNMTGSPLYAGNRITLLIDGPATYAAMLKAIRQARDHIDLETYIFEEEGLGQKFADLLLQKRAEGVKVHVIYDGIGSHSTPKAFFDRMRQGGIQLLEYNPLDPAKAPTTWQLNDRDHRRILCVDGKIAFTGGVNISHVYSSNSSGILRRHAEVDPTQIAWRDTDVQVEGPAVAEFEKFFLATWQRKSGQPLRDAQFFPKLQPVGYDIASVIGSSPQVGNYSIYDAYLNTIKHARRSIHITQAYFVPDKRFMEVLANAARRGVDVKLVLPSISDFAPVKDAGRGDYARLLSAGVHIYELKKVMLHAKTAVIDGVWSTVGSSNLDYRSFRSNDEINVVVLGTAFAAQLEKTFQNDLRHTTAVDPRQWVNRPFLQRAREDSAQTFRYLL